jgi:hypothetical protein
MLVVGGSSVWSRSEEPARDPTPAPGETRESAWLHQVFFHDISAYDFYVDADKQQKLKLHRVPALKYPTPVDYWGEVYVWTDRGRPAIVASIFAGPETKPRYRVIHEFHSLAARPLYSGGGGATKWQPEASGLKFEHVPDAPDPDQNEGRRFAQMREIAGRFTTNMNWRGKQIDMPLMAQPFFVYEIDDKNSPVVDGALFAFTPAEIIDPELLLAIEAQRTASGVRWYYAPVRFTNREAWMKYKGEEVWHTLADGLGAFDGVATRPYGAFLVKTLRHEAFAK